MPTQKFLETMLDAWPQARAWLAYEAPARMEAEAAWSARTPCHDCGKRCLVAYKGRVWCAWCALPPSTTESRVRAVEVSP